MKENKGGIILKFTIGKKSGISVFLAFEDSFGELKESVQNFLEKRKVFSGKKGEVTPVFGGEEDYILLGLGKKEDLNLEALRLATFKLRKELEALKIDEVSLELPDLKVNEDRKLCAIKSTKALVEGFSQGDYKFDEYQTKKEETPYELTVDFVVRDGYEDKTKLAIDEMTHVMEGTFLARDLVNRPPIDLYPETLAEAAVDSLEPLGIQVTVYDKEEIEKMDMHAFLAVAEGSEKEPKFIVMEYTPVKGGEVTALVGKGLTYDSGGYALKPAKGMDTMNSDMAGSASVIGTLYALAKNKVKRNVVGIIAACENMISGGAYKNGDIISSKKGSTIEVGNTDAEGRLTLADAIYYAATETEAVEVYDIATLTGAAIVAVGAETTAVMTNNDELWEGLEKAAEETGEFMHRLNDNHRLRESIKSDRADISNTGSSRWAGSQTAGLFLEHFVEGKPWIHLDIAGPSYNDGAYDYLPKYATGTPVKTLYKAIFDKVNPDTKETME